ncbi:MAG: ECF transporter S component, partial [Acidaminococcaceae bacterium]
MTTQKMVWSAVCVALGLVFPLVFHLFGGAGAIFLPMHLPVLLAGFILGERSGALVGIVTPLLSSFWTGMPPLLPVLPVMVVELGVYGYVAGYCYQRRQLPLVVSLLVTMLAGRLAAVLGVMLVAHLLALPLAPFVYLAGMLVTGLP